MGTTLYIDLFMYEKNVNRNVNTNLYVDLFLYEKQVMGTTLYIYNVYTYFTCL